MATRVEAQRRVLPPGVLARGMWWAPLMLAAIFGLWGLERFAHDAGLRHLDELARAQGRIVDSHSHRRSPDTIDVRFRSSAGQQARAAIPYEWKRRPGDSVEVAYRPDEPARARTVSGWSPLYESLWFNAAMFALIGAVVGIFGLLSGLRRGRHEEDAAVPPMREDRGLGSRVMRSSRVVQTGLGTAGVGLAAALLWTGLAQRGSRDNIWVGLAVLLFFGAMAGLMHWAYGRDGVWVTEQELVARRRGRTSRWPWARVHELGLLVDGGRVTAVAAHVEGWEDLGRPRGRWLPLARPILGPFAGHRAALRLRAFTRDRGIPLREGLTETDLLDEFTIADELHRRAHPDSASTITLGPAASRRRSTTRPETRSGR